METIGLILLSLLMSTIVIGFDILFKFTIKDKDKKVRKIRKINRRKR